MTTTFRPVAVCGCGHLVPTPRPGVMQTICGASAEAGGRCWLAPGHDGPHGTVLAGHWRWWRRGAPT